MVGDAAVASGRNSLQGIQPTTLQRHPAAGLHSPPISSTRLSTDLRVLSAGTRDFLLIGSAARDRPFSLHTSLLRRNLSLLVRTLEPLCSVQE